MTTCRICSYDVPETARFCGGCGAPAGGDATGGTRTLATSTPTPGEGRFAAGVLLAGRYSILGLAGRGGMGEVYRAHDNKLDQVVALKLLPEALRKNAGALVRLHNEVRVARQVSHPNVCRVYDIGEAEDLHFLTMEFIDGEDLARLLRRIGRFPQDKGIEIARKLCLAVAAAHDRGVLHRDLKPSNVMLNAAGQVMVTDFGLAAMAEQLKGVDAGSGTPAYMAPEQLEGREVTRRSDIYSLGLVLYEIFTGKRAFSGSRRDIANPSSVAKDLDPAVERVILRCLAEDPDDRPQTTISILTALPGGDPLEAALAAGETPSPEMVAAAGEQAGISVRQAVLCLAGVMAILLFWLIVGDRYQIAGFTPLDLPPEALAVKAREITATFGYEERPRDRAFGFAYDAQVLQQLKSATDRRRLRERRPTPIVFWYRESPALLAPLGIDGVKWEDPPPTLPGMISARLDPAGRLVLFGAVPPAKQREPPPRETDWGALFLASGFDIAKFEETGPEWAPPVWADSRRAWKGAYPSQPDSPVRIEAASLAGRVVFYRIVEPWMTAAPGAGLPALTRTVNSAGIEAPSNAFSFASWLGLTALACWLAWRNLRNGRGDRRGAVRLSIYLFAVILVSSIGAGNLDHTLTYTQRWLLTIGSALYPAFVGWVAYIALEPLVRRIWPQSLVSWSRMLAGRLRDPLLGRDILVGVLAGCVAIPLWMALETAIRPTLPGLFIGSALGGGMRWHVAAVSAAMARPVNIALLSAVLFSLLLALCRRKWVAAAVTWGLMTGVVASAIAAPGTLWAVMALAGIATFAPVAVLVRYGVTATAVANLTLFLLTLAPRGLDFSAWHQDTGRVSVAIVLLLAVYGFFTTLGGRRVFSGKLLDGQT